MAEHLADREVLPLAGRRTGDGDPCRGQSACRGADLRRHREPAPRRGDPHRRLRRIAWLSARDALIDRLSRRRGGLTAPADAARFCVGAAIGTGMAAQSAMRGGADFLLALSAGRMRNIGEPSIAAMLPFLRDQRVGHELRAPGDPAARDRAGVLRRGLVPSRPRPRRAGRRDRRGRLLRHREFPDRDPDRRGLSAVPRRRGARLQPRARAARDRQAQRPRDARLHAHPGGGVRRRRARPRHGQHRSRLEHGRRARRRFRSCGIEEAALMANTIARAVHAISPDTLCVVEGGPIVNPRQLEESARSPASTAISAARPSTACRLRARSRW